MPSTTRPGADAADRPRTLYEKIWDAHAVERREDGQTLLYIDRHYVHEGSRQAFELLSDRGLPLRRLDRTWGMADHYAPSGGREAALLEDPEGRDMILAFERNMRRFGVPAYELQHPLQGIVHVAGPEQGLSLPGSTIVCGDSHTSTHGALGALAFGIGASEVSQVLATQTLWQRKSLSMAVEIAGRPGPGVYPKDVILAAIGRIGAAGATGHVIEYRGEAVRAMSVEGRMTLCNMSIEAGARAGLVVPDETTLAWVAGRPHAPGGALWEQACAYWRGLSSDAGARYDRVLRLDVGELAPMTTWGTSLETTIAIDGRVPDPARAATPQGAGAMEESLRYMGLRPGMALREVPIGTVFIGSCTNGRLEDLQAAARVLRGRRIAPGVKALAVPGSESVRRAAEAQGLHEIFLSAGFDWRHAGCSMCVGMNGDLVPAGTHCASTSNRNFAGRQGRGARTHLVSPATAAACALEGRLADVRAYL